MSYLVCRNRGAEDWWHSVPIGTDGSGSFKLEHHHIQPKSLLTDYPSSSVNEMANLAFISAKANRKISNREPDEYLVEVPGDQRAAHLIPLDESLYDTVIFEDFLAARRQLLAEAMNEFLDSLRPPAMTHSPRFLSKDEHPRPEIDLWLDRDQVTPTVAIHARLGPSSGAAHIPVEALKNAIGEAAEGLLASLVTDDGDSIPVNGGDDRGVVAFAVGPVGLIGTANDWAGVLRGLRPSHHPPSTDGEARLPLALLSDQPLADIGSFAQFLEDEPPIVIMEDSPRSGGRAPNEQPALAHQEDRPEKLRHAGGDDDGLYQVWFSHNAIRAEGRFHLKTNALEIKSPPAIAGQYRSPSAAARRVVELSNPLITSNRNGWKEWHLLDGRPIAELRR